MAAPTKRFAGKSVIITGSSGGMGAGFAKALAAEGAHVSLTGRNVQALEKVVAEIKALGSGKVVHTLGDITSPEVRKKLVENTLSSFGKIDILINNAGMGRPRKTILDDIKQDFEDILDVNLRSVYHLTSLVAPHIVKTKGNIINISSIAGLRATIGAAPYCIAKCGLDMMTRCLAAELAPHGVRVNGINAGPFNTDFVNGVIKDEGKKQELLKIITKTCALGRIGEVEDITALVLFFASEQASFITGSNSTIDGGRMLSAGH